MSKFLSETNFDFKDKKVLVRIDCDVDLKKEEGRLVVDEDFRLKTVLPTLKFLSAKGAKKIILMGHLGRPVGKKIEELSLEPVAQKLKELLNSEDVFLLENLRFNKGEEENSEEFAKNLSELGEVYVNEAFGVSHREHASIVGIPKFLPSFLGLRFEGEIKVLSFLKARAVRPLIFVLGGSKPDKLDYIEFLSEWCDKVLVGGKIPLLIKDLKFEIRSSKLVFAELNKEGRDITKLSVEEFKEHISKAKTIIWAGPMGVYEEKENQKGTFEIAKAIAESKAFKIAGGGDTHRIISWLNLWDKFDFVSVAGGAMLAFLKDETLPGIEATLKTAP